jgi:hypothetical protein
MAEFMFECEGMIFRAVLGLTRDVQRSHFFSVFSDASCPNCFSLIEALAHLCYNFDIIKMTRSVRVFEVVVKSKCWLDKGVLPQAGYRSRNGSGFL